MTKQQKIDELTQDLNDLTDRYNDQCEKARQHRERANDAEHRAEMAERRAVELKHKCAELWGENRELRGYLNRIADQEKQQDQQAGLLPKDDIQPRWWHAHDHELDDLHRNSYGMNERRVEWWDI